MAKRVLIIQTAFLGDLLLSIPLLKNTKRVFNGAEVWLLCRKGLSQFFTDLKLVDRALEVNKKDIQSWNNVKSEIAQHHFDAVICPHQSLTSAIVAKNINASLKVGFSKWWNGYFFDQRVERPDYMPDALKQLRLLTPFDSELKTRYDELESLFNEQGEEIFINKTEEGQLEKIPNWASMRIDFKKADQKRKRIIFIAPGSVWATKRWVKEGFQSVGQYFSEKGFQIYLVGSAEESDLCNEIAKKIQGAENLAGKTSLTELVYKLADGSLMISNDNGAMHLASVAGTPTVAIFGPTTLDLGYRPWNDQVSIVAEYDALACRPCGKHGHQVCPIKTHECMKNISAELVIKAAELALKESNLAL